MEREAAWGAAACANCQSDGRRSRESRAMSSRDDWLPSPRGFAQSARAAAVLPDSSDASNQRAIANRVPQQPRRIQIGLALQGAAKSPQGKAGGKRQIRHHRAQHAAILDEE